MSNFIPNSFQTPNAYVDQFMYLLSGPEYKVLCYLVRRIFGFQKRQDRVSIRQIGRGTQNRDGEFLDHGTGLSNASVVSALQNLIIFRLVRKVAENNWANEGAMYELQLDSAKVDCEGLIQREDLTLNSERQRTEAARLGKKPGILSDRIPEKSKALFRATENLPPAAQNGGVLSNRGGCSVQQKGALCPTEQGVLSNRGGRSVQQKGVFCPTETQNQDRKPFENSKAIQGDAYRETKSQDTSSPDLSRSNTPPEIILFHVVTNRYPAKDQIPIVIERLKDRELTAEELKPYWSEWVSRDHRRTSLGWLDWVDKRQIPGPGGKNFTSIMLSGRTPSEDIEQNQIKFMPIDPKAKALWDEILGRSREDPSISRVDFETWVNSAIPSGFESNCLYISCANQIGCNWLQQNFTLLALKYVEQSSGEKIDICFKVAMIEKA